MSEQIQPNETRNFEHLANSLPQIIWTARPDGFLDYYNERWYQFTGSDRGHGGDQSWIPLLHPEDVDRTVEAWYHSVKTGDEFKLEVRFMYFKTKKYIWHLCNARAARNSTGEIIKWYGSCTDIDKQKKTEQQVVDILEGLNDSFFSIDADWNLSRINSRMEATTHIKREEAVGKNFFLSFPMEKDSKYWINHHKIMNERVRVQYEEYYEPLDLWTEARGYPTADGGIAYLFRDITEEKRAQKKLEALTVKLQEAVHVRDDFLSISSHELLTPITSLKLQLQMFRRYIDPRKGLLLPVEKLARMVEKANSQINRLQSLIDGLLDISRMDAGKMSYQFQNVDFSALVNDVVERFCVDFGGRSLVKLKAQPDIHIECDPFRIEQVLVNLLSNAVKYGNEKEINVVLEENTDEVSFSVQDNGIGIPKDKQDKIFERFERLISFHKISGMGLGLYIVKQIVSAHNGKILLESDLSKGSKFTVLLPKKNYFNH